VGAPVIGKLHELKRSEEGQTLVLAAVFGLVLMVCVLGTVNLGRAVYDKVQLQSAADSAAYSQAAVEARVMNFTAYTNRAMVVHYASLMAATSYLTYLHFEWPLVKALLEVLGKLPWVGPIFAAIQQVVQYLMYALDAAVFAMAPLITANNIVLYGLQEGAWWGLYFGRLSQQMPTEGHSGDSAAHPYHPIWPEMIPLMNQVVFAQTRGHSTVPQATYESSVKFLANDKSDVVQEARLHMLEVANSARQPWSAYGDGYPKASWWPSARHFTWRLGPLSWGNHARTELGQFKPKGLLGALNSAQIWSGQQNSFNYDFHFLGIHLSGTEPFFTFVGMDQLAPTVKPFNYSYFKVGPSGWLGKALFWLFPPLKALKAAVQKYADQTKPKSVLDTRVFLLSPYVYFAPRASNNPGLGPFGKMGNFAQPDVLVGLAKQRADYNREQGASKYYGRKFSWSGKAAGSGSVDFSYTPKDWPRIPGLPRQMLHEGLNAFAAAQVYYHRPGDWKEQPNFFNPLWGARLMPIAESNVLARLGLSKLPGLTQYLMH
jgi:hypothetical protein